MSDEDREYCEGCDALIDAGDFDYQANLCNDCADLMGTYDEDESEEQS